MYLQNMLSYPLGGKELYKAVGKHYAHDIYLDTYSDSGALAFVAVLIMMGYYIVRSVRLCVRPGIDGNTKKMLVNILIVFLIIFGTEPILDGTPWLFASFCVLYGSIARLTEFNDYQQQGAVKHAYS